MAAAAVWLGRLTQPWSPHRQARARQQMQQSGLDERAKARLGAGRFSPALGNGFRMEVGCWPG